PNHRWQLAAALGKIAPSTPHASEAVAVLNDSLANPNHIETITIVHALANFGPKAAIAIPRLQQLQGHEDHEIRFAAAETLAKISSNE
ncbi:HEAT repeat domain-containing protein, partial [Singulisphaera rosea]